MFSEKNRKFFLKQERKQKQVTPEWSRNRIPSWSISNCRCVQYISQKNTCLMKSSKTSRILYFASPFHLNSLNMFTLWKRERCRIMSLLLFCFFTQATSWQTIFNVLCVTSPSASFVCYASIRCSNPSLPASSGHELTDWQSFIKL